MLSHTHIPFDGPLSGTTRVSRYQKGKTDLDFTEARDSEWQWHQLGHMQVSTSLQANDHASTPLLRFLQAGCPSCRPTNSVKALNTAKYQQQARRARLKAKRTAENVTNTGLNIVLYPAICRTEVFIKTAVQISINILTNSKKICLPSFNGDCQQRK